MRLGSLLAFTIVGVFGIATAACHRVRVDDVRSSDGSEWKRLSCRHLDKHCYRTAQKLCPNGYYFTRNASVHEPFSGSSSDNRDYAEEPSAPRQGPPAGAAVRQLPPQEDWDRGMYSRERGAILIQCARATSG
ncbi:MAG: hypothetical protein KF819_30875 [Labilithrix sp.]|nr:hypothetical protein [Labilithrix sp.]